MNHKVLTPADYRQMPWKNGLGVTSEIAREPADDSRPFVWRLSVADIKEDGPFSLFAGYQRVISTLTGAGMVLTVDGEKSGPLLKYQPFAFSGEAAVTSELIDGPIRDFNLIYRPDLGRARLEWLEVNSRRIFCSQADQLFIFTVGGLLAEVDGRSLPVPDGHTLSLENQERQLTSYQLAPLAPGRESRSCLVEIFSN